MFGKNGPSLIELLHQALCSTEHGYDLLAPKFDATPFRTPDEILAPAIAEIGPVDAGLDICCGTGAGMRFLRPMCRRRLVGLDFSAGMLDQARTSVAGSEGMVEPEFIRADMFDPQFHGEFDLVVCFGALGHVPEEREREFARIVREALRPGGRFVFVTGYRAPILSIRGVILRAFNLIMRIRNAVLKPPFIMYYLTFVLPEIADLLDSEGFSVEVREGVYPPPLNVYRLVIATKS